MMHEMRRSLNERSLNVQFDYFSLYIHIYMYILAIEIVTGRECPGNFVEIRGLVVSDALIF